MTVFGLQFDMSWEKPEENFALSRRLLEKAAIPPESLIILPEMYTTGFSMKAPQIVSRERILKDLKEKARQFQSTVIGGGVESLPGGKGRNVAFTCAPGGEVIHEYAKIFTFTYGGESSHFEPGRTLSFFHWQGFKVAVLICYDLRFPELFRAAVKEGVNLFVVIASWPKVRAEHWNALLKARAIENQSFVAGINRCGKDPVLEYSGDSLIINPRGEIVAHGKEKEGVIAHSPDLEALESFRRSFPALEDMNREFTITR